jgi:hypothetical protein
MLKATVSIPVQLAAEIDRIAGPRKRRTFIARVIEQELRRLGRAMKPSTKK